MGLGAATTLLGTLGQFLVPLVPGAALERISTMPEGTPAEREAKLSEAENALKEFARRERSGKSWQTHAVTGAANLGSGLIVWLGFKRSFWEGMANFALNMAVTEIQIWPQPTGAIREYDRYLEKYGSDPAVGYRKPHTYWSVNFSPGKVGICFTF